MVLQKALNATGRLREQRLIVKSLTSYGWALERASIFQTPAVGLTVSLSLLECGPGPTFTGALVGCRDKYKSIGLGLAPKAVVLKGRSVRCVHLLSYPLPVVGNYSL